MQSPHCDHGSVLAHSCCYRAALNFCIVHVLHLAWLGRPSALWEGRTPSPPSTLRSVEEASSAAINVQGLPKRQSKQYVFAIHAEGAGVETYGYLRDHELQDSTEALLQQTLRPKDPRGVRGNHDELCHRNFLGHYCHSWRHLPPEIKEWDAEAEVAAEVAEEVTEQDVVKRNAEESVTEEWDGTQWNVL
jgi:hypothetical protein